MNILDILLDEENQDAIVHKGQNDNPVVFAQIAVIPFKIFIFNEGSRERNPLGVNGGCGNGIEQA